MFHRAHLEMKRQRIENLDREAALDRFQTSPAGVVADPPQTEMIEVVAEPTLRLVEAISNGDVGDVKLWMERGVNVHVRGALARRRRYSGKQKDALVIEVLYFQVKDALLVMQLLLEAGVVFGSPNTSK